jgi:hypothetical protein
MSTSMTASALGLQAAATTRAVGRASPERQSRVLLSADLACARLPSRPRRVAATPETRLPRKAGLSRGTVADLHSKTCGSRDRATTCEVASPAFVRTRYSRLIVADDRPVDGVLSLAGGDEQGGDSFGMWNLLLSFGGFVAGTPTIAIVAERSSDAGNRRDPDVAIALARPRAFSDAEAIAGLTLAFRAEQGLTGWRSDAGALGKAVPRDGWGLCFLCSSAGACSMDVGGRWWPAPKPQMSLWLYSPVCAVTRPA